MISFKGAHYPRDVILFAVFFYVRYPVSYRDLEEIMAKRGVVVDHATLNRWVVKYAPLIADKARKRKVSGARSWRADETYIKVKGKWGCLYRAIDKHGQTLDFMLSGSRDHAAVTGFFWKTLGSNGVPDRVIIDKGGANTAGLNTIKEFLNLLGIPLRIEIIQAKNRNIIIEQDHRFIKRLTRQMKGFKSFVTAAATLADIEVAHMIRKDQFEGKRTHAFKQFVALAA